MSEIIEHRDASRRPAPFRVVALVSTFNEEDVIAQVLDHLAAHGVSTYVLDDGSTDSTPKVVEAHFGKGVIGLEHRTKTASGTFNWAEILKRKEQLSRELAADWFIHHDADELREAPWPGTTLVSAIEAVDRAGYNAIEFAALDFWPLTSGATNPSDLSRSFTHYQPAAAYNHQQVKCWKANVGVVDLASSGGHDALFSGRRVFPLRFILKHFPVRSEAHGRRKILEERLPRFTIEERGRGWHVQYDAVDPAKTSFARDSSTLIQFDATHTRLTLALQDIARMEAAAALIAAERAALASRIESTLEPRLASATENIRLLECALARSQDDVARAHARHLEAGTAWQDRHDAARQELNAVRDTLADTTADLTTVQTESARLNEALTSQRDAHLRLEANAATIWVELQRVYTSRTWRWTRAGRMMARWVGLGGGNCSIQDRRQR